MRSKKLNDSVGWTRVRFPPPPPQHPIESTTYNVVFSWAPHGRHIRREAEPISYLWSLSTSFDAPAFFDGDLNTGDPEVGGTVNLQPVMPFPLYGEGENQWKMITRPVLPIVFNQPIPKGFNKFNDKGGLGDLTIPMLPTPPTRYLSAPGGGGQWILAAGPTWYFPTSTSADLGSQQFGVGPGLAFGYKNKHLTAVTFTQYWFGIGGRGDRKSTTKDLSSMALLYALIFNLPDAWQIGLNPTITYNDKAASGDKWNVPVGLFGGKTIMIGGVPFNLRAGLEYSAVSPDSFGKRVAFRFQVTPVIPSLVQKPIFGGAK